MTLNQIDGGRWEDCFRGLVLDKKKCCDQKTSGGRKQCKADGNQGMCGVDGKEHRAVGDQTDTVGRGHSEICKQGKVVCKSHLPSWFVRPCRRCQRLRHKMRRLPKKIYRFGKADWEKIRAAASDISGKVSMLYKAGEDVDTQWNMFKDAPTDT